MKRAVAQAKVCLQAAQQRQKKYALQKWCALRLYLLSSHIFLPKRVLVVAVLDGASSILQVIEYRDCILKDCNRLNRQWLKELNSGYTWGLSFSSGSHDVSASASLCIQD